jgi:hypothetical protein
MQFVKRLTQAREEVQALLPDIDIHMEIYPGWTIKEMLAHLAGWDDATILALKAYIAGEPPPTPADRGLDAYNAQTIAERSGLNYDQIVREWEWVRGQLIPILYQIEEEKLGTIIVSPWGDSMTIAHLLNIMIEHEEEHAEVIRACMANPGQPL